MWNANWLAGNRLNFPIALHPVPTGPAEEADTLNSNPQRMAVAVENGPHRRIHDNQSKHGRV